MVPKLIKNKLILHESGYWINPAGNELISYPEQGNEFFADIEEESFWFNHRNRIIISGVKNYPPLGMIFDIGGGNGFVARGLIDAGFECAVVEPGQSGARKAAERGIENVFCGTFEAVGFENGSVPAVGLFDVIEHIEDDREFLGKIQKLLTPGGRVYATVPAYNMLWSNEDVAAGHFRRYTIGSISRVFNEAGFEIEYITYFFRFLPPAIFLLRSLPSFLFGDKKKVSAETGNKSQYVRRGFSERLLNKLLDHELRSVELKKRINFGGSCFIAARSVKDQI